MIHEVFTAGLIVVVVGAVGDFDNCTSDEPQIVSQHLQVRHPDRDLYIQSDNCEEKQLLCIRNELVLINNSW